MTTPTAIATDHAERLRHQMTDALLKQAAINDPWVEAAFRRVPRHRFVPTTTPLGQAYDPGLGVVTKRDSQGRVLSAVSPPRIHARMIEQAALSAGMRVLEGGGGCNAALVAEVVGPTGHVVSIDIDDDVTHRAQALLAETGYNGRVTALTADAGRRIPGEEIFDAVLVTAACWDIAPVWLARLAPGGVLVLPLAMNGITRSVAFQRSGNHLAATSTEALGFAALQGEHRHPTQTVVLPDGAGAHATLEFDSTPDAVGALDGVLGRAHTEAWSGVTLPAEASWADLYLYFASFTPSFCRLAASEGTALAAARSGADERWLSCALIHGDALAYLTIRPDAAGRPGVEFGARAFGNDGAQAAKTLIEQIQAWDLTARHSQQPSVRYWPNGADYTSTWTPSTAVLAKKHGTVTIAWPSDTAAPDSGAPVTCKAP